MIHKHDQLRKLNNLKILLCRHIQLTVESFHTIVHIGRTAMQSWTHDPPITREQATTLAVEEVFCCLKRLKYIQATTDFMNAIKKWQIRVDYSRFFEWQIVDVLMSCQQLYIICKWSCSHTLGCRRSFPLFEDGKIPTRHENFIDAIKKWRIRAD